jgi:hypothetical protein
MMQEMQTLHNKSLYNLIKMGDASLSKKKGFYISRFLQVKMPKNVHWQYTKNGFDGGYFFHYLLISTFQLEYLNI